MENEHVTKEDLRYVEGRLEGQITQLGEQINHRFDGIQSQYADKASVGDLHKKYWDINNDMKSRDKEFAQRMGKYDIFIAQVRVWAVVGGVIFSLLSGIFNNLFSHYFGS